MRMLMNKQEVTFPSFLKNWLMRKGKIQDVEYSKN